MAAPQINDATIKQDIESELPDNILRSIKAYTARGILFKVVDWIEAALTQTNSYAEGLMAEYPNRFSTLATILFIDGTSGNDSGTGSSGNPIRTLNRAAQIVNGKFSQVELRITGTVEVSLANGGDVTFYVPTLSIYILAGVTNKLYFRKRTLSDDGAVNVGEGQYRLVHHGYSLNVRVDGVLETENATGSTGAGDQFYYRNNVGAINLANPVGASNTGNNITIWTPERSQVSLLLGNGGSVVVGNNTTLFVPGTNGTNWYGSKEYRYRRSVLSGTLTLGTGSYEQQGMIDGPENAVNATIYVNGVGGNDGWSGFELARPLKTMRQVGETVRRNPQLRNIRIQLMGNTEVTEDVDLSNVDDVEILLNGFQLYHRRKTVNGKEGTFALTGMRNVFLNGTGAGSEVRTEALSAPPTDADFTTSADFMNNQCAYRLGSSQYGGYLTGRLVNGARVNLGNYTTLVGHHQGISILNNGVEYLESTPAIASLITLGTKAFLGRRLKHMVFYRSVMAQNEVWNEIVGGDDHALLSGYYVLSCYAKTQGYGGTMQGAVWTCRFPWFAGLVNQLADYSKNMESMSNNTDGKSLTVRTWQGTGSAYNQSLDFKLTGESLTSACPFRFEVRRLSYDSNQTI
ncbi:hypothetical protein [Telluribacter humicola]|uniref:hypothetical protein n=1 Tax=Telluribacter humicola TaxID=1720261 RepID=UPI001A96DEA6|nr:hypothetical protein [Telluribacter humicola]